MRNRPFAQVQPLRRTDIGKLLDDYVVHDGFDAVPAERWHAFREWVDASRRDRAHYATQERRRRAAEE
jgi:hypothetical protein